MGMVMKMKLGMILMVFVMMKMGLGQVNLDDPEAGNRREMVPAMFIFGDSLIDNGNNNDLASLAKANYFPYGIDFNGGPTGRFSNGYTMVDQIDSEPLWDELGFELREEKNKHSYLLYEFSLDKYSELKPFNLALTWRYPVTWSCPSTPLYMMIFSGFAIIHDDLLRFRYYT